MKKARDKGHVIRWSWRLRLDIEGCAPPARGALASAGGAASSSSRACLFVTVGWKAIHGIEGAQVDVGRCETSAFVFELSLLQRRLFALPTSPSTPLLVSVSIMRPSLSLFGAELIPMARKAEFPLVFKPRVRPLPSLSPSRPFCSSLLSSSLYLSYLISKAAPKARTGPRTYPIRKQYLYDRYRYMLSSSRMLLAFQHTNLSLPDLERIRDGIASVKLPEGVEEGARVTVLKGGVFGAVCDSGECPDTHEREKPRG